MSCIYFEQLNRYCANSANPILGRADFVEIPGRARMAFRRRARLVMRELIELSESFVPWMSKSGNG
jgi:hypothetical protein